LPNKRARDVSSFRTYRVLRNRHELALLAVRSERVLAHGMHRPGADLHPRGGKKDGLVSDPHTKNYEITLEQGNTMSSQRNEGGVS